MSLPFLEPKKMTSVIMAKYNSKDSKVEPMHEEGEMDPGLMACAEDLLSAISMKSAEGVAKALKDAWEVCESYEEPSQDEAQGE